MHVSYSWHYAHRDDTRRYFSFPGTCVPRSFVPRCWFLCHTSRSTTSLLWNTRVDCPPGFRRTKRISCKWHPGTRRRLICIRMYIYLHDAQGSSLAAKLIDIMHSKAIENINVVTNWYKSKEDYMKGDRCGRTLTEVRKSYLNLQNSSAGKGFEPSRSETITFVGCWRLPIRPCCQCDRCAYWVSCMITVTSVLLPCSSSGTDVVAEQGWQPTMDL